MCQLGTYLSQSMSSEKHTCPGPIDQESPKPSQAFCSPRQLTLCHRLLRPLSKATHSTYVYGASIGWRHHPRCWRDSKEEEIQIPPLRASTPVSACMSAKLIQSCLTLWDPMDRRPPGSSVCGILQARILEWVAMPSSRGSSQPRDPSSGGGWVLSNEQRHHCRRCAMKKPSNQSENMKRDREAASPTWRVLWSVTFVKRPDWSHEEKYSYLCEEWTRQREQWIPEPWAGSTWDGEGRVAGGKWGKQVGGKFWAVASGQRIQGEGDVVRGLESFREWGEPLKGFAFQKRSLQDFPGVPVAKTLNSQCREPGFEPWSGN